MAKEFKDFDTMFSKQEIKDCRAKWLHGDASGIKFWKYRDLIELHSNAFIRECVYFAEGSLDWQLFRVSLKGLSTQEKLLMLERRWDHFIGTLESDAISKREKCRIDNYMGALVRGGQLAVGTYEVLR